MARIIPGVQVDVVKEVVPPPANPSGIVGLIGITDRGPALGARVGTWKEFVDTFGAASAYSLPEARQVFENGAFEVVVVPALAGARRADVEFQDSSANVAFRLRARAAGTWANDGLVAEVTNVRNPASPSDCVFDLVLRYRGAEEVFRNLQVADPGRCSASTRCASSATSSSPSRAAPGTRTSGSRMHRPRSVISASSTFR